MLVIKFEKVVSHLGTCAIEDPTEYMAMLTVVQGAPETVKPIDKTFACKWSGSKALSLAGNFRSALVLWLEKVGLLSSIPVSSVNWSELYDHNNQTAIFTQIPQPNPSPEPELVPDPKPERLRKITFRPYAEPTLNPHFVLRTYDPCKQVAGKHEIAYKLTQVSHRGERKTIFAASDFYCSPMHAIDSDETCMALMSFLTLKEGDTDQEYFANYTKRQIEFRDEHAEALNWAALCKLDKETIKQGRKELSKHWPKLKGDIKHFGDLNWLEEDDRVTFSIIEPDGTARLEHLCMDSDYTWLVHQEDNIRYQVENFEGKDYFVPYATGSEDPTPEEYEHQLRCASRHEFTETRLNALASYAGTTTDELREQLSSADPHTRARVYDLQYSYGGPNDYYPIEIKGQYKRAQVAKRYRNAVQ